MWAFWSTGALLVAAALLFVLPPLLRRPDELDGGRGQALALAVHRERLAELDADAARGTIDAADHARERMELERRVAEELPAVAAAATSAESAAAARWLPWGVAAGAAALAVGVYLALGEPRAAAPAATEVAASGNGHAMTQAQMLALVDRLATRLKSTPDDADGWHMLARSYVNFSRHADAALAYERAATLQPGNPHLLADYADVLAMANGRSLEGRPMQLVAQALKVDPRHGKSLALAGTAAFNRKDYAAAIGHWRTLQATLPPDSDGFKRVAGSIADAQARLVGDTGGAGLVQAGAEAAAAAPAAAAPGADAAITGQVVLAEAIQGRLAPGSTLFVFARAAQGPRMPLAIQRLPAGGLPADFKLDDSQAMSPQTKLSQHAEVMLGARLSRSGNATPQSGDLMGTLGPVKVGTRGVRVVIDGVVP